MYKFNVYFVCKQYLWYIATMFTGLIEEVAIIKSIEKTTQGAVFTFFAPTISIEIKIGDSVAVNGCCTTVTKKTTNTFTVEISNQTLCVSNFSLHKVDERVNLERAMKLSDRLNGHLVSGHIDGTAKVIKIEQDGFSIRYKFETDYTLSKYILNKGSVSINGISLTVAETANNTFTLCIIPHTQQKTNLIDLKIGSIVNLELDIVAKYIEKFLLPTDNESCATNIDEQFLYEKGFL